MRMAIREAETAAQEGNFPFGAVIADEHGQAIAAAHNTQVTDRDPTAHAEINLIRKLAKEYNEKAFGGFVMVCNAESCSMCFSASIKAGISSYILGAPSEPHMDPYLTVEDVARYSQRKLDITYGVLAEECAQQIRDVRKRQGRLGQ